MTRVAIVGGGIGGLTAAVALHRKGFQCEVFEQAPEFREIGAAISIWPNALRVYRKLDLLDKILGQSCQITEAFIRLNSGEILVRTKPNYGLPAICVHRADLLKVLVANVPADLLHSGHRLVDYRSNPGGNIILHFDNGVERKCDLLIAADGVRSLVRKRIVGDGEPLYRGYNVWRGVASIPFTEGYCSETMGRGARVGVVQIRQNQFGWWASVNEPLGQSDEPEGTVEKLKKMFSDWHPPIPALFENSPVILKNGTLDRDPVRGWHRDNVVLLGDAAHPSTPNLGQGACMAIEGAFVLSECLAKYGIGTHAYNQYEEIHFPRTRKINRRSRLMGQIGQLEGAASTALRNWCFRVQPDRLSLRFFDTFFNYDVTGVKV